MPTYKIKYALFLITLLLFANNICPQPLLYADSLRPSLLCKRDVEDKSILAKVREDIIKLRERIPNVAEKMHNQDWWEGWIETGHSIFENVAQLKKLLQKYKLIKTKDKSWKKMIYTVIYLSKREFEYFKTKSTGDSGIIDSYIGFYTYVLNSVEDFLSAYEDIIAVAEATLPVSDDLLLKLQGFSDRYDVKFTRSKIIVMKRWAIHGDTIRQELDIGEDLSDYFTRIGQDLVEIRRGTNVKTLLVRLMEQQACLSGKIQEKLLPDDL